MDTRFELNIKKFSIKGDAKALYLYINGNLLLKFSYRDIETAVRFLLEKAQVSQLSDNERKLLMLDNSKDE